MALLVWLFGIFKKNYSDRNFPTKAVLRLSKSWSENYVHKSSFGPAKRNKNPAHHLSLIDMLNL